MACRRLAIALIFVAACHGHSNVTPDAGEPQSVGDASDDLSVLTDAGVVDVGVMDVGIVDQGGHVGPMPYDWVGIIGTGQSLSVGWETSGISTTQPFHNLKLVDTGPAPQYPIEPNTGSPKWATALLTEPTRAMVQGSGPGYDDSQYPGNTVGETPHSGMANTLTQLWSDRKSGGEYVTAHTVVGWSGHALSDIDKEGTGRAYPASLEETRVWKTLAHAQGKSYGVAGIILTHGESDASNPQYGVGLYAFWQDYVADLEGITGQTRAPVLFVSQQSTVDGGEQSSAVQTWQAGVAHPGQIICTGPKYQYDYNSGGLHMQAAGYEQLGEKYAEVFDLVVNQGVAWKPLQPEKISRSGAVVTLDFDVPNPPLVFDAHIPLPHQSVNTEWKNGKGFEAKIGTTTLTISSVAIMGSQVVITLSADPGNEAKVTIDYAITQDQSGTNGGTANGFIGALRDSDAFVGWDTQTLSAQVTNGSAVISATTTDGFLRRAVRDVVSGANIANDTVVLSMDSTDQLTLSAPWTGATGTAMLSFRHDHSNYCVHFTMTEP